MRLLWYMTSDIPVRVQVYDNAYLVIKTSAVKSTVEKLYSDRNMKNITPLLKLYHVLQKTCRDTVLNLLQHLLQRTAASSSNLSQICASAPYVVT